MEMSFDRNFMEEVLTAATQWGKEKHFFIKKIIKQIGEPFIEPLLDRLTEEESKTLRLLYLDLLKEFGGAAKDQIIGRLGDKRWYVVRNLLFVLRQLNDPSVLSSIYNLFNHHDQRVRYELLHTFLSFKDPRANNILLKEMNSGDSNRCLKAITLASMTRNSDVFDVIVGFIKKKGLNKTDLEIKKASVLTLAEIGDPSFLPVLQTVLKSFSLFSRQRLKLLKLEILTSLGKYPAEKAFPILQKIANSRSGELAFKAAQAIKTLKADRI
jgi:HEAT repeat protein